MKGLIIFVTAAALAAVIGAVVVGSRSFEGLVTEKPYESGIAWDKTRREKSEAGWEIVILEDNFQTGDCTLRIRAVDRGLKPLTGAAVAVTISRPNTTAYDRNYAAVETLAGIYQIPVHLPAYGYWDIKIAVSRDKNHVLFDKRIFVKQKGDHQ